MADNPADDRDNSNNASQARRRGRPPGSKNRGAPNLSNPPIEIPAPPPIQPIAPPPIIEFNPPPPIPRGEPPAHSGPGGGQSGGERQQKGYRKPGGGRSSGPNRVQNPLDRGPRRSQAPGGSVPSAPPDAAIPGVPPAPEPPAPGPAGEPPAAGAPRGGQPNNQRSQRHGRGRTPGNNRPGQANGQRQGQANGNGNGQRQGQPNANNQRQNRPPQPAGEGSAQAQNRQGRSRRQGGPQPGQNQNQVPNRGEQQGPRGENNGRPQQQPNRRGQNGRGPQNQRNPQAAGGTNARAVQRPVKIKRSPAGQGADETQSGPQDGSNGKAGRKSRAVNPFVYNKPPPIKTSSGIKALSQDGNYALSWWAARWIGAMENLVDGRRLSRGKSYAKEGQVLSIEEKPGGVQAMVQGSRPKPYRVVIEVIPLSDLEWEQVFDVLASQALFAAQLLAGEMPRNIEEAFRAAGSSLFPARLGDLHTDCSCPDWANPCKHVAATHYILAERFDEDPFLLFRLRGRTSEQILTALRERRAGTSGEEPLPEEPPVEEVAPAPPLDANLPGFYSLTQPLEDFPLSFKAPSIEMAVLKRLGDPNFLGQESLLATLEPVYRAVRGSALEAALGESKEEDTPEA